MMFFDILPDALQQIAIATSFLFFAYALGRRKIFLSKNKIVQHHDEFYYTLVKWLLITTAFLYAEAVFQTTVAMAEGQDETEDADVVITDGKTTQWLKTHSDLFWVVLAFRQTLVLGILGFELMSENKVRQLVWFGAITPLIQWHVGLFSKDPMSGAVVGLLFETLTPLLLMVYLVKVCMSSHKIRVAYAFFANLFYMVSTLPVLFLALAMRGPHEVLYLTVFFGILSFFCWSRAVMKTPVKSGSVNIEKNFVKIPNDVSKEEILDMNDRTNFTITSDDMR